MHHNKKSSPSSMVPHWIKGWLEVPDPEKLDKGVLAWSARENLKQQLHSIEHIYRDLANAFDRVEEMSTGPYIW